MRSIGYRPGNVKRTPPGQRRPVASLLPKVLIPVAPGPIRPIVRRYQTV